MRQKLAQLAGGRLIRKRREGGAITDDLFRELLGVAVSADRHETKAIGMACDHIESALADGTRGAEYGDTNHATTPQIVRPKNSTGAAPVTLSIRSITPPCPGKRVPLSLTPAK